METKIINTTPAGLRELLAAVPESGTREQIVYIDVDDLTPDPKNFYSLSDMEGLMSNIALFGVQQPLRVRDDPEDLGRYIIVSGHRRREAVRRLVEEDGREDLRELPCIVESVTGSEARRELQLICGNSDTRKMTGAEISEQAQRVQELLYKLQEEEGYEFPGRMRDYVAEACKVSKSKLSRLKVIREKLIPVLEDAWARGQLNEEQAYTLAQMDGQTQKYINDLAEYDIKEWYGWRLADWGRTIKAIQALECPVTPGPCGFVYEHIDGYLDKNPTHDCGTCCIDCWRLMTCPDACHMSLEARKKKEEEKAEAKMEAQREQAQRTARQSEKDQEEIETLTRLWTRVGEVWRASGVDEREASMVLLNEEPDEDDLDEFVALANSPEDSVTARSPVPILPYSLVTEDLVNLCGIADFFHCSLDYLLGRTDEPEGGGTAWRTGKPSAAGRYYARFDPEAPVELACRWTGESWQGPFGNTIEHVCCGWVPLPEKE